MYDLCIFDLCINHCSYCTTPPIIRMKEIEFKFLVNIEKWEHAIKPQPERIVQGYLSKDILSTVRVRIKGERGYITVKSKTVGHTRDEYEYEIPVKDAEAMLSTLVDKKIDKLRFTLDYNGKIWEVDQFLGKLEGLYLAEIELQSEDESFDIPEWATRDVSGDPNYFNSVLIEKC